MKKYVKVSLSNGVSSFGIVGLVKQNTSINLICTWGKKESAEKNLEPGFVLKITESLQNSHCMAYFDNLFNRRSLIMKLYERVS